VPRVTKRFGDRYLYFWNVHASESHLQLIGVKRPGEHEEVVERGEELRDDLGFGRTADSEKEAPNRLLNPV
jgi:hypothetical protein